jgi:hypothetical protein
MGDAFWTSANFVEQTAECGLSFLKEIKRKAAAANMAAALQLDYPTGFYDRRASMLESDFRPALDAMVLKAGGIKFSDLSGTRRARSDAESIWFQFVRAHRVQADLGLAAVVDVWERVTRDWGRDVLKDSSVRVSVPRDARLLMFAMLQHAVHDYVYPEPWMIVEPDLKRFRASIVGGLIEACISVNGRVDQHTHDRISRELARSLSPNVVRLSDGAIPFTMPVDKELNKFEAQEKLELVQMEAKDPDVFKGIELDPIQAAEEPARVEADVQTEDPLSAEADVQTEDPLSAEADVQTEDPLSAEADVRTEDPLSAEADVQTEEPVSVEADVQTEDPLSAEADVQTDPLSVEADVQTEDDPLSAEADVQTKDPFSVEADVQTEEPVSAEVDVQTEEEPLSAEADVETEEPVSAEVDVQTEEEPLGTEADVQTEEPLSTEADVQTEEPANTIADVQTGDPASVEADVQTEEPLSGEADVQTEEPLSGEADVQTEEPLSGEADVQTENPVNVETGADRTEDELLAELDEYIDPVQTEEAQADETPAEPEAHTNESTAEPEAQPDEPPAEPEAQTDEPTPEPEAQADEPPAEPEAQAVEPPAEPEAKAEDEEDKRRIEAAMAQKGGLVFDAYF